MNNRSGDSPPQPPHEEIAARAYELYFEHGHDVEHWLQAESELRQPEGQLAATERVAT